MQLVVGAWVGVLIWDLSVFDGNSMQLYSVNTYTGSSGQRNAPSCQMPDAKTDQQLPLGLCFLKCSARDLLEIPIPQLVRWCGSSSSCDVTAKIYKLKTLATNLQCSASASVNRESKQFPPDLRKSTKLRSNLGLAS